MLLCYFFCFLSIALHPLPPSALLPTSLPPPHLPLLCLCLFFYLLPLLSLSLSLAISLIRCVSLSFCLFSLAEKALSLFICPHNTHIFAHHAHASSRPAHQTQGYAPIERRSKRRTSRWHRTRRCASKSSNATRGVSVRPCTASICGDGECVKERKGGGGGVGGKAQGLVRAKACGSI